MEEQNRGGAPEGNQNALKFIDWAQVSQMASIGCTGGEIADVLGVSPDTLTIRCKNEHGMLFKDYIKKSAVKFKVSMRRAMYKRGMEDNSDTMLIWLSKNFLGMTDNLKLLEDDTSISDEEFEEFMDEVRDNE